MILCNQSSNVNVVTGFEIHVYQEFFLHLGFNCHQS